MHFGRLHFGRCGLAEYCGAIHPKNGLPPGDVYGVGFLVATDE